MLVYYTSASKEGQYTHTQTMKKNSMNILLTEIKGEMLYHRDRSHSVVLRAATLEKIIVEASNAERNTFLLPPTSPS